MKPIDVKALAEEAGFIFWSDGWRAGKIDWSCDYDEDLQRFADLVEAYARADEREACARVCEGLSGRSYEFDMGRLHSAAAIRARGEA